MKIRLLQFSIFTLMFLLSLSIHAQQIVTGILRSSGGEPLSGASIVIKGSNKTVTANNRGQFSIDAPIGSTLIVTSVGYQRKEILVTGTAINEVLQVADASLNEVVVIGYQSVRRRDLTGANTLVNNANASKISAASVGESIQGLVPGVTVRNGGAPGENSRIEIRGVGSFQNSDPLFVIDGMIADANSTINTDDVASIQVLKDASAAAIYGSRAANGVIIITTKKGREGPTRISGSAKYGVQQIPNRWNVMNSEQFLNTQKLQYQNSNVAPPAGISNPPTPLINTDWQDEIYRTGNDQDYNLNLSGGSASGSYLISGSYYKNKGVLVSNAFERASVRVNTESRKGRLTVGENLVFSNTNGNNPGEGVNAFYEAPQLLPLIAVQSDQYKSIQYNPAGWGMGTNDLPSFASNYIANAALARHTYNFAKIVGNAYVDVKLTNWLNYRFNAGLEASFDFGRDIRDTGIWRYSNQPPATSINENRSKFTNVLYEHTLNFNKSFKGGHSINGVVGYSQQEIKRDLTAGGRTYLTTVNGQTFTTIGSASGTASADGGITTHYRIYGLLGRVNYNYNDKYLVTFSGRIDQDSRFGPNYRTGNFYSAALAWRISKEKFFNVSWISDLKLRASYGELGINTLNSWEYLGIINNSPRAVYGLGQTSVLGAYQAQITNPDLRWENRNEKNIGLDASLLDNKLSLTLEVYNNLSKNVLVNLPLPIYLGSAGGNPSANAGSIKNTGLEIIATYRHNTGAIHWDITANGTTIKNRVISVGSQGRGKNYLEPDPYTRSQIGHALGEWFVLKDNGIFQNQAEIDNYKNKAGTVIQPQAKPGDIKFEDINGDGQINNDDRTFSGSPWPTFQGGAQFNISYKDFSLNIQLVGIFGSTLYNDIRRVLDSYQNTNFRTDINPWSPTNTNTSDPRLGKEQGSDPGISSNNRRESTRWLENGSYFRVRNVELGYTFSQNILKTVSIKSAHVYLSGQNLITLTKYTGLDPDVTGNGILERGFDNGNWPSSRRFSAGIQFEF